MKKLSLTIALSALISMNATAMENCLIENQNLDEIQRLADGVNDATAAMSESQKVLNLTVTKFGMNQGSGKVSVLTDEKGNLAGVRVDFNLKGKKSVLLKTFNELKNGQKLEYFENSSSNSAALVVKKAAGTDISPTEGGKFTFSLLGKKPGTYMHHNLFLRKEGNSWVVKNEKGVTQKSVDLTPNVSGMNWNGTFSSASFE